MECALSAYELAGCPEFASQIVSALAEIDEDVLLKLASNTATPLAFTGADDLCLDAVNELIDRQGVQTPSYVAYASFPIGPNALKVVMVRGCEDPWFHGMRLDFGNRPLVFDWRRGLAEILAIRCHNIICGSVNFLTGRNRLEMVGFLRILCGGLPDIMSEEMFAADFGLRKRRFDGLVNLFRAILATRGSNIGIPSRHHADIDLKNARKIDDNPFAAAFYKVEVSNRLDENVFQLMCSDFERMIGLGLVPTTPSDLLALRIRGLSGMRYRAAFQPLFRDVLVPFKEPGLFVHEYGHAIDTCLGYPSNSHDFQRVLRTYRELVVTAEGCPYHIEYLHRPSEAFARCFELYCKSLVGDSILLRTDLEPCAYPRSDDLQSGIRDYFDTLL